MTIYTTSSCWKCGDKIVIEDASTCPQWLKDMKPPRLLCNPCCAAIKKTEEDTARLAAITSWTADDVTNEPERAMKLIGVPENALGATLDLCDDIPPGLITKLRAWTFDPKGIVYLYGQTGSGKSWVAIAILWQIISTQIRRLCEVRFVDEHDFKASLKEIYQKGQGHLPARALPANHPQKISVLVFDDLASTRQTDWGISETAAVIGERYKNGLATIITSNLDLDELGRTVDPRLSSRIGEGGLVFKFPAKDLRIQGSHNNGQ